jgi:hypothetical protein
MYSHLAYDVSYTRFHIPSSNGAEIIFINTELASMPSYFMVYMKMIFTAHLNPTVREASVLCILEACSNQLRIFEDRKLKYANEVAS